MLTEKGFSSLNLLTRNTTVFALTCQGLNSTTLVAALPDFGSRARAYALSADGELVGLVLPGEKRISACRCDPTSQRRCGRSVTAFFWSERGQRRV
jgi:hypothetical protein